MTENLERALARELREIAARVDVPAMPSLLTGEAHPTAGRFSMPLVAAAAVVAILGVLALALGQRPDGAPQPAGPGPATPSVDRTARPDPVQPVAIASSTPRVPYVLNERLYADGLQVPGRWSSMTSPDGGIWLALNTDGSWWYGGGGRDPVRIDAQLEQPPVISPNGRYVAWVDVIGDRASLTGSGTQSDSEGLGRAPLDLPAVEGGVPLRVRAVTDFGDVVVQGSETSLMWRAAFEDGQTVVDLNQSAAGQVFLDSSVIGLIVVDGADGAVLPADATPYVASISPEGTLTTTGSLPRYDAITVSPQGTWLAYSPAGTLGGEVSSVDSLMTQRDGIQTPLEPPERLGFAPAGWNWEDDQTLIATVVGIGSRQDAKEQLARCDLAQNACVLIDELTASTPVDPEPNEAQGSYSAAEALDSVLQAVAVNDRTALIDQDVVADAEWNQLVGYAAGQGGSTSPCRDNGSGTRDCEILLGADPTTVYYAILDPAENAYGWRVTYVSIAEA